MADVIRIKRSTGASAPPVLANAELAYSEGVAGGGTLYIGVGSGGANGTATQVVAVGGPSTYATKTYVDSAISSANLTGYLTTSSAASTYLTQSAAASTYATPGYVTSQITAVVGAAPAALDTLQELAAALSNDGSFAATVTASLAGKAATTLANVDPATGRTSLGLGSMATQSASNVAITGGTIDGVTLDGGTY